MAIGRLLAFVTSYVLMASRFFILNATDVRRLCAPNYDLDRERDAAQLCRSDAIPLPPREAPRVGRGVRPPPPGPPPPPSGAQRSAPAPTPSAPLCAQLRAAGAPAAA